MLRVTIHACYVVCCMCGELGRNVSLLLSSFLKMIQLLWIIDK